MHYIMATKKPLKMSLENSIRSGLTSVCSCSLAGRLVVKLSNEPVQKDLGKFDQEQKNVPPDDAKQENGHRTRDATHITSL